MSDNADAAYTPSKDVSTQAPQDNTYAKFSNQEGPVKVQVDSVPVEDPIDPKTADSDAQLGACSRFCRACVDPETNFGQSGITRKPSTSPTSSVSALAVLRPRTAIRTRARMISPRRLSRPARAAPKCGERAAG